MKTKNILLMTLISVAALSHISDALAYPSKRTLQKIDHALSLATTAAFAGLFYSEGESDAEAAFFLLTVGTGALNIINNGILLGHGLSTRTIAQLTVASAIAIPVACKGTIDDEDLADYDDYIQGLLLVGLACNGLKNFWDVCALVSGEPDEQKSAGNIQ